MALPTRPLGRTGLALTEIGFGAGPLGGFYGPVDADEAVRAVRAAWAGGVRYFDVAPLYGHGRAELLLGQALRELPRDGLVLSTKIGRILVPSPSGEGVREGGLPFRPVLDYSRDGALRSLEHSMLRLGTPRLDIALIHDVDAHAQGSEDAADRTFRTAMSGAYPALLELKRAGAIHAVGIGLNQVPWALRWLREADLDCVMIAGRYTLLNQEAAPDLFPECQRRGVAVLAAGPFNGGLLARDPGPAPTFNYRPAPPEVLDRLAHLRTLAAETGTDLPAAAIQFVLRHPAVTSLVIGAMTEGEVQANFAARDHPISNHLWPALDALS